MEAVDQIATLMDEEARARKEKRRAEDRRKLMDALRVMAPDEREREAAACIKRLAKRESLEAEHKEREAEHEAKLRELDALSDDDLDKLGA